MPRLTVRQEWEKVVVKLGGEAAFSERTKAHLGDWEFLEKNREELAKRYADQWIAIYRKEVVAVDAELKELLLLLKGRLLDPSLPVICFLSSKPTPFIL